MRIIIEVEGRKLSLFAIINSLAVVSAILV